MFTWDWVCKHTVFFYSQGFTGSTGSTGRQAAQEDRQHRKTGSTGNRQHREQAAPPELCAQHAAHSLRASCLP